MTDTDDTPQAPGGGEEHHEERQLRTTRKRFLIGLGALLTGVLSYFAFVDVIFRRGAGNGGGTATVGGAATGTIIPAPADSRTSRTVRRQPVGRPSFSFSSERDDWVLAMQIGRVE